ncbi:sporulation protein [Bacillus sp. FJAT-50079]|uniref:sporulation protein n=1 Tax=Bacillus sp. FJAT-50079 TaxID=2833577 RepID=UPI001BCA4016|nr:sporulation protein [Bacillus sp. FJAT-50079]MBS4208439.1 sporulation protein [Bacillus sp. FJAT-50079]
MILRKYMSLLGIGSATIDLTLPKKTYKAGEHINGSFIIKGGIIEQNAKRIDCDLIMTERTTGEEKIIDTTTILTSKLIHSEEVYKVSYIRKIPAATVPSSKDVTYHFRTKLIFKEGVASKDRDMIDII